MRWRPKGRGCPAGAGRRSAGPGRAGARPAGDPAARQPLPPPVHPDAHLLRPCPRARAAQGPPVPKLRPTRPGRRRIGPDAPACRQTDAVPRAGPALKGPQGRERAGAGAFSTVFGLSRCVFSRRAFCFSRPKNSPAFFVFFLVLQTVYGIVKTDRSGCAPGAGEGGNLWINCSRRGRRSTPSTPRWRRLFEQRMQAVGQVARYKAATGKPVFDPAREDAVLDKNTARLQDEALRPYYRRFLQQAMAVSRAYQRQLLGRDVAAYQGVQGAWSHIALWPASALCQSPGLCHLGGCLRRGGGRGRPVRRTPL